MATNNYSSNTGGGFQGLQSDYWMYGLGDSQPEMEQSFREESQANQGYLEQLGVQKAKQEQDEYMRNTGMRQAADWAATSKSTLEDLTSQQGIAEAPMKAKKSIQDIYDSMDTAKRTKMQEEMKFLGQHGQELIDRIEGIQDPAEKNKVWSSFMETFGGDTTGMERWSPNNEMKIKKIYETFLNNPEFQRLISQEDNKHANDMELQGLKNSGDIEAAGIRAASAAKTAATRVVSKVRAYDENGKPGDSVTYQDGHTEWLPATGNVKDPAQRKEDIQKDKDTAYVREVEDLITKKQNGGKLSMDENLKVLQRSDPNSPYNKAKRNLGTSPKTATKEPATKTKSLNNLDMRDYVINHGYPYEPDKYMYRKGPKGEVQRAPKG